MRVQGLTPLLQDALHSYGQEPADELQAGPALQAARPPTCFSVITFESITSARLPSLAVHFLHQAVSADAGDTTWLTLYLFFRSTTSARWEISPSMLYTPSTTIRIFFQGRRVLGCP